MGDEPILQFCSDFEDIDPAIEKKSLVRHNRRQICSFFYTLLQLRDFPARRGATGSGKSTQVPKFLMNLPGCTVGMAEPRVVAAESLARRVAAERHEPLGENVGFATGEEWRLPEQTIDSCVVARIGIPTARECPLSN